MNCCKNGDKPLGFKQGRDFLNLLNDYQFVKQHSMVLVIKNIMVLDTYVGSTTAKRGFILPYTIGQECITADGQSVRTRPLSRNPNKKVLHGSMPFRFNDEELLVLLSSWKP